MNRPLIINPLAEEDTRDASAWYEGRRAGLGDELRLATIVRVPYTVVYRIDDSQITVVAVYHTSRDPREWQSRR